MFAEIRVLFTTLSLSHSLEKTLIKILSFMEASTSSPHAPFSQQDLLQWVKPNVVSIPTCWNLYFFTSILPNKVKLQYAALANYTVFENQKSGTILYFLTVPPSSQLYCSAALLPSVHCTSVKSLSSLAEEREGNVWLRSGKRSMKNANMSVERRRIRRRKICRSTKKSTLESEHRNRGGVPDSG